MLHLLRKRKKFSEHHPCAKNTKFQNSKLRNKGTQTVRNTSGCASASFLCVCVFTPMGLFSQLHIINEVPIQRQKSHSSISCITVLHINMLRFAYITCQPFIFSKKHPALKRVHVCTFLSVRKFELV